MFNIHGWWARLTYILHWRAYRCEHIRRIGVSEMLCLGPVVGRRKTLDYK